MSSRFRGWIRELMEWAAPELFARRIQYIVFQDGRVRYRGEFQDLTREFDAPWQIVLPEIPHAKEYDPLIAPERMEYKTFFRLRGSISPIIYLRNMEDMP